MSPEPEKRSDDEIRWDLHRAIYGAWDAAERVFADVPSLLAALAASRADNDQLRAEVEKLGHRLFPAQGESYANEVERQRYVIDQLQHSAMQYQAEAAAARAEVSQLRAKIEQVEKRAAHESGALDQSYRRGWNNAMHQVRSALAEPLGSTPEQEQAK